MAEMVNSGLGLSDFFPILFASVFLLTLSVKIRTRYQIINTQQLAHQIFDRRRTRLVLAFRLRFVESQLATFESYN